MVVEVAASAAIFCKACRRMSLDALQYNQYTVVATMAEITYVAIAVVVWDGKLSRVCDSCM